MFDDISPAKLTTKPRFDNAICQFYHEPIPSSQDEKNTQVKTARGQRKFQQVWHKQGSVVNFEHVT